jgi:hypothetical protein
MNPYIHVYQTNSSMDDATKWFVTSYSYSLLAPQPRVGLYLLHGFVTEDFSRVGLLAPHPTRNLEDQGLHFVWPLSVYLSDMGGPTRNLRSRQHTSPGHWGAQAFSPR